MKLKIPGKSIYEIRIPIFCYIQVIVFDLSYLPVAAVGTKQVRCHEKNVKNTFYIFHNLNVTEVRDLDLKNAFPGILNFTVAILFITLPLTSYEQKTGHFT